MSAITHHLDNLTPFLAMEVFAKAQELEKQGKNIIHLEFGEPDFPTPEVITQAAIRSIEESQTKYTHTQGIELFREAVVNKYKKQFNVSFTPSQIITSTGSSILLYMAMRLLVPPGDEIIMTDPCYACFDNLATIAGITPVKVQLHLEDNFQLDIQALKKKITKKTKAILINTPMNPTGTVFSKEVMQGLADLEIPIISDEIYTDLVYEGDFYSMLNFTDNCIVINGLSKYYAMTGWRLGYMIFNQAWRKAASHLHQNMMISATHFIQQAGTVALTKAEADCEKMKVEFGKRRSYLLKRLKESGLDPQYTPTGAFYVLLKSPTPTRPSLDLSLDILEKAGVALTPGVDFGKAGEGFLRFSYANSMANLDEAVNRLSYYFKTT